MKARSIALGLTLLAAGAHGADDSSWYVTPHIGYTRADGDRNVDDAAAFGFGVGHRFNDAWALEVNGLDSQHDAGAGNDLDLAAISADVVRSFGGGGRVSPFLTAGIGALNVNPDAGSSRDDFMYQAGAGLLIRAWQSASGDRTFSLRPEAKVRFDDAGGAGQRSDILAGLGFQFDFGAPKISHVAAPPAAPTPAPVVAAAPVPAPVVAPPKPLDTDGDGVLDDADQCPGTPVGTAIDEKGCPRKGSITLVGVNFENNSARLLPESLVVLDGVAGDLKQHPRLKVEVQGHTDSVGSDAYNLKLSQSRADAVRERLVAQGVNAAQITARGYGESRPIAANETPEGRAQNRRVAMEVLDNPGDVEVRKGQ